ncbi:hypothetical protein HK104_003843, partial [Borealophlyctis nickersoniae]
MDKNGTTRVPFGSYITFLINTQDGIDDIEFIFGYDTASPNARGASLTQKNGLSKPTDVRGVEIRMTGDQEKLRARLRNATAVTEMSGMFAVYGMSTVDGIITETPISRPKNGTIPYRTIPTINGPMNVSLDDTRGTYGLPSGPADPKPGQVSVISAPLTREVAVEWMAQLDLGAEPNAIGGFVLVPNVTSEVGNARPPALPVWN